MNKYKLFTAVIGATVFAADSYSKLWSASHLVYADPIRITKWLDFTLFHNTGAFMSWLAWEGGWQTYFLIGVSLATLLICTKWFFSTPPDAKIEQMGISIFSGGIAGNLFTRATDGYVIDFIHVHYQNHYMPIFNVADIFIYSGMFLIILSLLVEMFSKPKEWN